MKRLYFIAIFLFFAICFSYYANATTTDFFSQTIQGPMEVEKITANDLGVSDPKILPDSNWYWMKEWWRGVRIFFSLGETSKAQKLLKYSNEKLYEIKVLADKKAKDAVIQKAFEKYIQSIENLKKHLGSMKDKKKVEKIIDAMTQKEFVKNRIFGFLQVKLGNYAIKYKEKSFGVFGKLIGQIDIKAAQKSLTEYVDKNIKLDAKSIKDIQFIDKIKDIYKDKGTQESIGKIKDYAFAKIGENIKNLNKEDLEKTIKEFLGNEATTTPDLNTKSIIERIKEEKIKIEKELQKVSANKKK